MPFDISELYRRYPKLQALESNIYQAFLILNESVKCGGKILICGNGGSASDAEHMAGELLKSFMIERPVKKHFRAQLEAIYGKDESDKIASSMQEGIKAITLTSQTAFLTAFSNDCSYRMVFAQQVYVIGDKNDVLVAFSSSGSSENIVMALKVAGAIGMKRILFTGAKVGIGTKYADLLINVPETETYKIQEYHLPIYHALCAMLEEEYYGKK